MRAVVVVRRDFKGTVCEVLVLRQSPSRHGERGVIGKLKYRALKTRQLQNDLEVKRWRPKYYGRISTPVTHLFGRMLAVSGRG